MANPLLLTDFYKTIHHLCYAENMTKLFSYWTPRMSRKENMDKVVMFGLQPFLKKYLIDYFNENFFNKDKKEVIDEYKRIILIVGPQYAAEGDGAVLAPSPIPQQEQLCNLYGCNEWR